MNDDQFHKILKDSENHEETVEHIMLSHSVYEISISLEYILLYSQDASQIGVSVMKLLLECKTRQKTRPNNYQVYLYFRKIIYW